MIKGIEIDLGINSGIGSKVLYFHLIASTNDFLKSNAAKLPSGTVVWANEQTEGRGRFQRKWFSPAGKGLYFSILLKPDIEQDNIHLLSLMTGLVIKKTLETYAAGFSLNPQIIELKWPNDLLIQGKKLAGILVEGTTSAEILRLIVGIGINISSTASDFPPDLRNSAGSLVQFFDGDWDKRELLKRILLDFEFTWESFNSEAIIQQYRNASTIWGKPCEVETMEGIISGICKDISDRGELIIETISGEKNIISGTLRLL
jgi:BirA family biotin operon repressor/biotin-[acetyl-CoA-carboxylase] ligase